MAANNTDCSSAVIRGTVHCSQQATDQCEDTFHSCKDYRLLFKLTRRLIGNTRHVILATFTSAEQLANTFSDFYTTKVINIRSNISIVNLRDISKTALDADVKFDGIPLEKYSPATHDEVKESSQMLQTSHAIWTRFLHGF